MAHEHPPLRDPMEPDKTSPREQDLKCKMSLQEDATSGPALFRESNSPSSSQKEHEIARYRITASEARHKRSASCSDLSNASKSRANYFSSLGRFLYEEMLGSTPFPQEVRSDLQEKQREVYDFVQIPWHLERLLWYGFFICLDTFLYIFSVMPFRICAAIVSKLLAALKLRSHRYDLIRGTIGLLCLAFMFQIDFAVVYHYIRGQAVLKLYVIFNVLEVLDKLCCSFGQDIFDSLYLALTHTPTPDDNNADTESDDKNNRSKKEGTGASRKFLQPATHALVALLYTCIHAFILYAQVTTLNVAVNSYNNALLTLLISNQFVELKGGVFKKFEKENLFQLSCSDVVERFQLFVFLFIITLCNFYDLNWEFSRHWLLVHAYAIANVILTECLVDWIKHCFITKFNRIPPEYYAKFSTVLASDLATLQPQDARDHVVDSSHRVARRIGFVPLPLACLFARVMFHILPLHSLWGVFFVVAAMCCGIALKIVLRIILLGSALKTSLINDEPPSAPSPATSRLEKVDRFSLSRNSSRLEG